MHKCGAELVFITLFVIVIAYFIIGIIYQIQYGRIISVLIEVALAMVADQIKSVVMQVITYWFVIRRLGKHNISPEFKNGKWDDEAIFNGGIEPSLFFTLREAAKNFVENSKISALVLYMTVVLMVVIFTELAISNFIGPKHSFGWYIFYVVNYFLLLFFIIEIVIKVFAYGHLYFMELINSIDAAIVIVSFVFHVMEVETKSIGLLRVLRLIKVISGMKKVVDEKRER